MFQILPVMKFCTNVELPFSCRLLKLEYDINICDCRIWVATNFQGLKHFPEASFTDTGNDLELDVSYMDAGVNFDLRQSTHDPFIAMAWTDWSLQLWQQLKMKINVEGIE